MGERPQNWAPLEWFQTLLEWADVLVGGGEGVATSSCLALTERHGKLAKETSEWIGELCVPRYMPTRVELLEYHRQHMSLALFGQFVVVVLRFLGGDLGGGIFGAVVFVIGNNARCYLESSTLTGYIVMDLVAGGFDIVELVNKLFTMGLSALPFTAFEDYSHFGNAVSLFFGPAAEALGAATAWRSYPDCRMLFLDARTEHENQEVIVRRFSCGVDGSHVTALTCEEVLDGAVAGSAIRKSRRGRGALQALRREPLHRPCASSVKQPPLGRKTTCCAGCGALVQEAGDQKSRRQKKRRQLRQQRRRRLFRPPCSDNVFAVVAYATRRQQPA